MTIRRISPVEAKALLDAQGYVYLDVRSVPEFDAGHPAGAYNIPLAHAGPGGMQPNPDFLAVVQASFPKDAKIVLGCKSGGRSLRAAELLQAAGYTHVVDQRAGWSGAPDAFGRVSEPGWHAAGLPAATTAAPGRDYASLAAKVKSAG
jgi:rhodanese-related sulfurtransferase